MPSADDKRGDALEAVARSLPKANRPRLSTELEEHFLPVDRESARCYADAELSAARLERLAARIDGSEGIVDMFLDDTDSTVTHIEELRAAALPPLDEE